MTREVFSTADAPAPVASYSQACAAGGVLAVAGQVGVDPTRPPPPTQVVGLLVEVTALAVRS